MRINGGKKGGDETLKATIPSTYYDRSNKTGECGIFHIFGWHDNK